MGAATLTNKQARRFLLLKHGLADRHRFDGKPGAMAFVRQAGCVQFDPVDVCGKNAELVFQSRIKGFTKHMLYELLYEDRTLIDYFDKNLAIMPVEDWPYFARIRAYYQTNSRICASVGGVTEHVISEISERGPLCSSDLGLNDRVDWYWSDTKLSRAAMEALYFQGKLAIHHKRGARKFYDLAARCVPQQILNTPDPYTDELEHIKWRTLRRVGAVGLMWAKASDAWLNIGGMNAQTRAQAFARLIEEGALRELRIEGIQNAVYCRAEDSWLIDAAKRDEPLKERCELIAPLDNLLWDRRLIKVLFDFDYKWEIYTPVAQRKYGHYTLPLLYGERFAGRVEAVRDGEMLAVRHIWYEDGIRRTKKLESALDGCLKRFARFNGCKEYIMG